MSATPIPPRAGPSGIRSPPPLSPTTPFSPTPSEGRQTPTRRASAMNTAASAAERRARREQLRTFYGIKGEAAGAEEGAGKRKGKGKEGDLMDISSSSFDAAKYYERLIRTEDLAGLMRQASALASDIGNLHSERHALVYNHHHQLFAAGSTITHLNSRTPQLLGIMTELQQSFSEISRLADAVALPDQPRDQKVEQRKADWRRGVERLRLMVLADEPAEAIKKHYETLRPTIVKAVDDGEEGAKAMAEECERIVDDLPPPLPAADGQPEASA